MTGHKAKRNFFGKHRHTIIVIVVALSTCLLTKEVLSQGLLVAWTDPALTNTNTTLIRTVHINQMRTEINLRRTSCVSTDPCGLAAFSFGADVATSDLIRAAHINDLRTAISDLITAYGDTLPVSFSTPVVSGDLISTSHINVLRSAVDNAKFCGDSHCAGPTEDSVSCPADCVAPPPPPADCTATPYTNGSAGSQCTISSTILHGTSGPGLCDQKGTPCSASCNDGTLTWTNTCTPWVCTGTVPSNATLCSGDSTGLTADTPRTSVSSCTATKCEYSCDSGYILSGGFCVAGTCPAGQVEQGSCGVGQCETGIGSCSVTQCSGTPPPPPLPACPDGECNGTEDCSSCPIDCGACPPPPPSCDPPGSPCGNCCNDCIFAVFVCS